MLFLFLLCAPVFAGAKDGDFTNKEKRISVLLVNGLYMAHLSPLVSLGEELVRRGHKVTLIANVLNGSRIHPDFAERVGIKFISSGYDQYWTKHSLNEFHRQLEHGGMGRKELLTNMYQAIATSARQVKNKVEEIGADQYDIIVCDAGVQTIGIYYHVRGKRAVILNPMLAIFERSDLEWPFPKHLTGQSDELTFLERFFNAVILKPFFHFSFSLLFDTLVAVDEDYTNVLQNKDITYYSGTHMPMLIASSFGLEFPRAHLPLVEYVGPILFHSPPELNKDLKQWLDSKPSKTVVYISMGTVIQPLPASSVKAIHDGIFLHTSYSAVWVMKEKDQRIFQEINILLNASRLYLADWVAQQSLLRHSSISLSIIQCGMSSAHESLFNSHPVICIPSLFDQFDIATRVVNAGVGMALYSTMDKLLGNTAITAQMVANAIDAVSADDFCARNISRLRKSFQLAGGARRAADLIEFYEDVGYDHLVPAYVKYQWNCIQYYNCDVWMVLLVASIVLLWCCWNILKRAISWLV